MTWLLVPNSLVDEINAKLDSAFKKVPEAEKDREFFYQQLLNYVDQHGFLPDFELQKKEQEEIMDKTIICPGCGWTGQDEGLSEGACPNCGYENGMLPYRLLTLSEMLDDIEVYNGVRMGLFLKSLFKFLGYPDNQDEWSDYEVVHYMSIDGG